MGQFIVMWKDQARSYIFVTKWLVHVIVVSHSFIGQRHTLFKMKKNQQQFEGFGPQISIHITYYWGGASWVNWGGFSAFPSTRTGAFGLENSYPLPASCFTFCQVLDFTGRYKLVMQVWTQGRSQLLGFRRLN
jgi:hypothetical protein